MPCAVLMDEKAIDRALTRIAHEIMEKNREGPPLLLVGIVRRGVILARRLGGKMASSGWGEVPVGWIDIAGYRDDQGPLPRPQRPQSCLPLPLEGRSVVLVDDVLCTGRTARAAMDALVDLGRPGRIQLAALVDRGHRELPIRADYVGKNIPTARHERVSVQLQEADACEQVLLLAGSCQPNRKEK